MKMVYLDHQILIDEANWPRLGAFFSRGLARLALGAWNVREIIQGGERREERMEFVQSLSPLFMQDMLALQRRELRSFLSLHFFKRGIFPFDAFSPTFASFLRESFGIQADSNYSLLDYVRGHGAVAGDVVDVGKLGHMEAAGALAQSRGAWRALDEPIFHALMLRLIPSLGADAALADTERIVDVLQFCFRHRRSLFRSCPAICVEDALVDARAIDPNRRPRASDTADLFHCVSGLSHADFFVSADRWALSCARRVKEASGRLGVKTAALWVR